MTYENCLKYRDEADNDKDREFWDERIKRKYPDALKEQIEETLTEVIEEDKPKKRSKK